MPPFLFRQRTHLSRPSFCFAMLGAFLACSFASPHVSFAQSETTPAAEITLDSMQPIHLEAVKDYLIYTDPSKTETLELRETPISQWVNQRRAGGQLGHVFLWMQGDTPAAMGAIFSFPWNGVATDRRVVHELHALADTPLQVTRKSRAQSPWNPKSGLARQPISQVVQPVSTLARFNIQSRQVARRFTGYCRDTENQRWELRLLPTPLLVYPLRSDQGFGAIFGMMGDVGNDLESGLIIEAVQQTAESDNPTWRFAPIRLTDMETFLSFDRQPVWQSVRSPTDTTHHDSAHVYFRFQDRTVSMDTGR